MMKLKKKNQINPSKFFKFKLISQIHNSWNLRSRLNQETQLLINLMLNNKIKKKHINFKN
jgi:hypothetical protein